MRYQTDLMRSILQNETAQEIIDYVSRIYGNSYVALWVYEVIGRTLGGARDIVDAMRDEASPGTADLLLDSWEGHYGLPKDSSLTVEERRERLLRTIQDRAPVNPAKLAKAISDALGGNPVTVEENTARNTFEVTVHGPAEALTKAWAVLTRKMPAHLLVTLHVQIPFSGGVHLGAAEGLPMLAEIPIPMQADCFRFRDTLCIGTGRNSPVLERIPLPERRDNLRFAGAVHTGGHGGSTMTTMPIPEVRGE